MKKIEIRREFARLGEHDVRAPDDGIRDDVTIIHSERHENYNSNSKVNDIAMLYLERDVEFSGNFFQNIKISFFNVKNELFFFNHGRSNSSDLLAPFGFASKS